MSSIRRILIDAQLKPNRSLEIEGEELAHLTRVLRLNEGDVVQVLNGRGQVAQAVLERKGKILEAQIHEVKEVIFRPTPLVLAIGVLKGDAMEWVVEKAVERMLPKNALGKQMFKNMRVYAGAEHPHEAQQPETIDFAGMNEKNKRA